MTSKAETVREVEIGQKQQHPLSQVPTVQEQLHELNTLDWHTQKEVNCWSVEAQCEKQKKSKEKHASVLLKHFHTTFLLLACCYNISILYRFRDTTTLEVNVTACDIENYVSFNLKLQAVCTFQFMCKHIVIESHFIYEL